MSENWLAVPYRVRDLYIKYAGAAYDLMQQPPDEQGWLLHTDELGPVYIKNAKDGLLPMIGSGYNDAQRLIGGPNPLTSMLLSGALGAGIGYGGGWLANKLLPEYVSPSAKKRLAIAGGLGMAAIPALFEAYPTMAELGPIGLVTQSRFQGRKAPPLESALTDPVLDDKGNPVIDPATGKPEVTPIAPLMPLDRKTPRTEPDDPLYATLAKYSALAGVSFADDPIMQKAAEAGGDFLPNVPTDEWGRVIMRDPFLDDQSKAVAAGLPFAATASTGSNWVSPYDIARVAAGTALGGFMGKAIGAVAGPFMALTPKARTGLQQAGMLAGAVKSIMGIM